MHGDARRPRARGRGRDVLDECAGRVASTSLDADAIVVAVPPRESARLLGEPEPSSRTRRSSSVHLWFDRAAARLAAGRAARQRRALGLRPRRAHRLAAGRGPVPDRRLVRRARADGAARPRAGRADRRPADAARLGAAELLWSRVSREPQRDDRRPPGQRGAPARPARPSRPNVARAGAWTATGWPRDDGRRGPQRPRRGARALTRARAKWQRERRHRDAPRRGDRGARPRACSSSSTRTAAGSASSSRT